MAQHTASAVVAEVEAFENSAAAMAYARGGSQRFWDKVSTGSAIKGVGMAGIHYRQHKLMTAKQYEKADARLNELLDKRLATRRPLSAAEQVELEYLKKAVEEYELTHG